VIPYMACHHVSSRIGEAGYKLLDSVYFINHIKPASVLAAGLDVVLFQRPVGLL